MKQLTLALCLVATSAAPTFAQTGGFGAPQLITGDAQWVTWAEAIDLDGDTDLDLLTYYQAGIVEFENLGGNVFGPKQLISNPSHPGGVLALRGADLDGDGDADLVVTYFDQVVWLENLGGAVFSNTQVLVNAGDWERTLRVLDFDGDGDIDLLTGGSDGSFIGSDAVGWYENLGGATFGPRKVITAAVDEVNSVAAADLDGDGDLDVLSASYNDNNGLGYHNHKLAWYENLGGSGFGPQHILTDALVGPSSVVTADLDGDGDPDVLAVYAVGDKIVWFENLGGSFGPEQVVTTAVDFPREVLPVDLDGDGDPDLLSGSVFDDKLAWYENLGGAFAPQQVISTALNEANIVSAPDMDMDGDADVMAVGYSTGDIAWFENLDCVVTSYCTQSKATSVPGCSASLSVQNCTLEGGTWSTTNIPRDASLGSGTVTGIYIYTSGVGTGQSAFSAGVPFGTLCLNGFGRSGAALLPGAVAGSCNAGPLSLFVSSTTMPAVAVGDDVNVQLWYRDPTPANSGNANLSNAVFYTVF